MSDYVIQASEPVYRKAYPIKERQTLTYTFVLKDEAGVVIPASALSAAVLTVYSAASEAIVNSREAQNVLNANNVTISELGVVTWTLQPSDVTMLNQALEEETHRCVFLFTWTASGNTRTHPHEVDFVLDNIGKLS